MKYFFVIILILSTHYCANNYLLTNTKQNSYSIAEKLGKGINLGNSLEATPDENSWGNPIKSEYFELIKKIGFDTVRIPIKWSSRALTSYPYTISNLFFQRVDSVIQEALTQGLNIIINIHHYDELMNNPLQHKERFLELWKQISERYKKMPDKLLFEILNEPHDNMEIHWVDILTNAIKVIRATNPERILIIGGINWNSIDGLTNLHIPDDPNLIATFHFYEPYIFTHQGAEWNKELIHISNIRWPGPPLEPITIPLNTDNWISNWIIEYNTKNGNENPCSSNFIISRLDLVSNWSKKNKIPVWLGEFGVYGKYADIDSRARWTYFVRKECEKRNISWCYWEFSAGFGIFNPSTREWNIKLTNALLGE